MMLEDDPEKGNEPYMPQHDFCGPRRRLLFGVGGLVAVVVIVIISFAATGKNREAAPAYVSVKPDQQGLLGEITTALKDEGVATDQFLLAQGYQYKAFKWLTENEELASYNRTTTLQRYTLAALYYATNNVGHQYSMNPGPWINENHWLTNAPECTWHGVKCDDHSNVKGIVLEDNNLSGKLPHDLSLIREEFYELDLSSNKVWMEAEDFDLFNRVNKLVVLHLDDNFIVSNGGPPEQLKQLTDLQEFKASYNLMSGPLDNGVLQTLRNLTLLEIESNFLSGALPFLGSMPSLIYIYLRDNDLRGHLNFMKTEQKLTNLFSLWLDGNDIELTIPHEVSHLTNLASFSISNATLTGTIPSHFGGLPKLNRIWLYGNKLTGTIPTELGKLKLQVLEVQNNALNGTMPAAICSAVAQAPEEDKALVVDCSEVTCSNCCTRCV